MQVHFSLIVCSGAPGRECEEASAGSHVHGASHGCGLGRVTHTCTDLGILPRAERTRAGVGMLTLTFSLCTCTGSCSHMYTHHWAGWGTRIQ